MQFKRRKTCIIQTVKYGELDPDLETLKSKVGCRNTMKMTGNKGLKANDSHPLEKDKCHTVDVYDKCLVLF